MSETRSGFVAVVGRPNVGKSTLVNAIMDTKISIVTAKPQTTRHRILAIHTTPAAQIVFVDTPGLHREAGKAMNRMMNRTAAAALADADLILFLAEAGYWTAEDDDVLERVKAARRAVIAVLTKVDLVRPKARLLEVIETMSQRHAFAHIVPLSAKKRDNLDALMTLIPAFLPESPPLFPPDMQTDRGIEFRIAELIREKLMHNLHQEVPYGLTVQIEHHEKDAERTVIHAVIWVERESQKGIVVGRGGKVLKRVGRQARLELRDTVGMPVHLELWVKVKDNWADSETDMQAFGYETPP